MSQYVCVPQQVSATAWMAVGGYTLIPPSVVSFSFSFHFFSLLHVYVFFTLQYKATGEVGFFLLDSFFVLFLSVVSFHLSFFFRICLLHFLFLNVHSLEAYAHAHTHESTPSSLFFFDMSYTTPTNSILNRDESDTARVSQVIYENESLKIQVETLQEKLRSTGLLDVDQLRQENESLHSEVATLRVQLDEKTAQLEHCKSSDDRFSNIDQSLHELLMQIQTQRTEMAGMKDMTREKDARIAELTEQLKHAGEELSEAHAQLTAASADAVQQTAQGAEANALREQVAQLNTEVETLQQAAEEEAAGLRKNLAAAQSELLALKADAAAKSSVKREHMTSQEKEVAECREREASSQRQVVEMEARMELLRTECSQLKETQGQLLRKVQEQQQQLQQQAASAAAAANRKVDLYCSEVKAHVEKAVQNATDGVQRRLREQVEQNASLLSRMALIQQESEAMLKSKGMSNHEVTVMKERVDMRSRRNDARHTMQRRVAELLSNEELNKEDIELLLQEMLDYQEEQDQENRTMLVVKDIEAEERERVLRRELKRVKDENTSLMKQLQQVAMEGFHRGRSQSLSGSTGGAATIAAAAAAAASPREAELPSATPQVCMGNVPSSAAATAADGAAISPPIAVLRNPLTEHVNATPEPNQEQAAERFGGGAGATADTPSRPVPSAGSSSPQQPPPPLHQQRPLQQFGGDLWSNTPSRAGLQHAQPQYTRHTAVHADPQLPPPPQSLNTLGSGGGTSPEANRNVMVHCPACTYRQRYGNRNCEICDAVLQLN